MLIKTIALFKGRLTRTSTSNTHLMKNTLHYYSRPFQHYRKEENDEENSTNYIRQDAQLVLPFLSACLTLVHSRPMESFDEAESYTMENYDEETTTAAYPSDIPSTLSPSLDDLELTSSASLDDLETAEHHYRRRRYRGHRRRCGGHHRRRGGHGGHRRRWGGHHGFGVGVAIPGGYIVYG
ncbi:uncharacterized protein LOC111045408 [Nilaparvata lugens]|uniref:uncharacterized protein LOC111045408 n=1 Tax=Nilaparvata lugens TaxID=108931 RepID=UPI00193CBF95|nr:uncharacterized protein LOC111045408 [Nilaparvata lugens]